MAINSLAALNAAYNEGRWHMQRVHKNAGTSHSVQWSDTTFASGQPAYDAHVGVPLAFSPCVAQKNDAVWFPGVSSNQQRYLHTATLWTSQSTYSGPGSVVLFDLLGYYPLIDGNSTDEQYFDNTLTLPRYADGEGVLLVMVNHVAPAIVAGIASLEYVDSSGATRTHTVGVPLNGQNMVCSSTNSTASTHTGPIGMSLANGTRGVRAVNRITYSVAPGGLHALYMIKVLGTMLCGDNLLTTEKDFFIHNGFAMPRIYDGAWLGWFDMIGVGTARTTSWHGNFTFVWG